MPLQRNICTLILVARSSQSQSQSQSSHFSFPCKSEPPATSAARFVRFAHGLPKTRRSPLAPYQQHHRRLANRGPIA